MALRRQTWRSVLRETGLALVTLGVVVLLFVAYELVGTNFAEAHAQSRLSRQFSSELARGDGASTSSSIPTSPSTSTSSPSSTSNSTSTSTSSPTPPSSSTALPSVPPGGALDHLAVPAIGLDRYVVEGVDVADLQMGPGHYPGTPLPGQAGNVGIAGHRTTFGAPFFDLNELVPGDLVYLTDTAGNTWVYKVQRQWVVAPNDVAVVAPTPGEELTMTTCNPRFSATSRLVVRAALYKHFGRAATLPSPLPAQAGGAKASVAPPSTLPPTPSTVAPAGNGGGTGSGTGGGNGGGGSDNPTVGPGTSSKAPAPADDGVGGAGAWAGALGWGALALAGWVAARALAARRRHLGARATVLATGALCCLVPLWLSFGNVVDLLPSNI